MKQNNWYFRGNKKNKKTSSYLEERYKANNINLRTEASKTRTLSGLYLNIGTLHS